MTVRDTLEGLAQDLDAGAAHRSTSEAYLTGMQPLAFLSPDARKHTRLGRMASNIPAVQVTSIAERLRVTDLSVNGRKAPALWADYQRNDLDQTLPLVFREALGLGSGYVLVWDASGRRKPRATAESAHQCVTLRDAGTRETVAGLKRWTSGGVTHARLMLPDAVIPFTADGENASQGWREGKSIRNPLGVVPLVEFRNSARILGPGVPETKDLEPLVDALNKILADMMVGSEFYARPRRWATGVEMETDEDGNAVNPFPEGDRMMTAEDPETRFGQLPGADLVSYEAAGRVLLSQIMAISALPAHYLGQLSGQTPGADGLRAAEAALSARAESKQRLYGRPVEAVGALMEAVRTETSPSEHEVRVRWADPATRSVAQEADAVVKMHAANLLSSDYALARLGYDPEQIAENRAARRAESVDTLRLPIPAQRTS